MSSNSSFFSKLHKTIGDIDTTLRDHINSNHAHNLSRSSMITIAANDSSSILKDQADYVCDGTDDQVEIQEAIDNIPVSGGSIFLSTGVFHINSTITIAKPISWHGTGPGEYSTGSIISANAGFTGRLIDITRTHYGGGFFDIGFSGANMNQAVLNSNPAIYVNNSGDFMMHHCFMSYLPFLSAIRINTNGSWIDSCNFEQNKIVGTGAVHITDQSNWITNSFFSGNKRSVQIDSKWQNVYNCVFRDANRFHMACYNPSDHKITGNSFERWNTDNVGNSCIQFYNTPLYSHIVGNSFDATGSNGTAGIDDNGVSMDYCCINDNIFYNFGVAVPIDLAASGSNNIVHNNIGYVTENSGTATLANGTTSIVVTHGLNVTPIAGDIVVTPMEGWGNMTQFYIDTYTATQFTIHANIDPAQDVDFVWKAIIL